MKEYLPEVKVTKHEGTFLMWLDMNCLQMTSKEITDILAKKYGIAVGDGSHYGDNAEGFIRFNIGCARSILMQGLEAMHKMYIDYMK